MLEFYGRMGLVGLKSTSVNSQPATSEDLAELDWALGFLEQWSEKHPDCASSVKAAEQRLAEVERLSARKKLTVSEKELSGIIYERLGDQMSFARIRSRGDVALFGGHTTQDMKHKLGVPESRPLADFLPTITIKAKDFANEITNFNIKRDSLRSETGISEEHVKNNKGVRDLLMQRGIQPEALPPAEDIKKIERRVLSEAKKLPAKKRP